MQLEQIRLKEELRSESKVEYESGEVFLLENLKNFNEFLSRTISELGDADVADAILVVEQVNPIHTNAANTFDCACPNSSAGDLDLLLFAVGMFDENVHLCAFLPKEAIDAVSAGESKGVLTFDFQDNITRSHSCF